METRFFNRELSWIEFNGRVLHQALRKELPLMERIQFLAIVTSNFDEFFQVRVASIKRMLAANPHAADVSGILPDMLLKQVSSRVHGIIDLQHKCLNNDILPRKNSARSKTILLSICFKTKFIRFSLRSARTPKFFRISQTFLFMRHFC